jgi:uncharacterized protein (DUF58 family)
MRSLLAARRRAAPVASQPARAAAKGAYVSVADLAMLEGPARHLVFRPRHPARNLLAGRHASRVRGRGLDFEDLRQYQPGDDVRTIDWQVTARMPHAFVRVYTEEKDRPVTVVVDQRINMFFGTKLAMKSVTAAEAAALCAWRALTEGDRVAGVVFDDAAVYEHRLDRNRGALLRLLGRIATCNNALRADSPIERNPAQLDAALDLAARIASHDHLVIVVTDCDGRSARTRDLLRRMAMRNDVVVFLIFDPFLYELPGANDLIVTDGALQVEVPLGANRVRRSIADAGDRRLKDILLWQHEIGVTVAPLTTAEETAVQLRHLIGTHAARAGRGRA